MSCRYSNPPEHSIAAAIRRYVSGEIPSTIYRDLNISAGRFRNILKARGVRIRNGKETLELLRSQGLLSKMQSAGMQKIDISEWRGYKKEANKRIANSIEWRRWKWAVFKRDKDTCVMCGYKRKVRDKRPLDPHHIVPKSIKPELIFDVDNGVTLCRPCHRLTLGKEEVFAARFIQYVAAVSNRALDSEIRPTKRIFASSLMGLRLGMLFVFDFSHKAKDGHFWWVICDCGTVKQMRRGSIVRAKSCGCLSLVNLRKPRPHKRKKICKHGHILSDENVIEAIYKGHSVRKCRECCKQRMRKRYLRIKHGNELSADEIDAISVVARKSDLGCHGAWRYRQGCRCDICKIAMSMQNHKQYLKRSNVPTNDLSVIGGLTPP